MNNNEYQLRPMVRSDLELVLEWRNSDRVRSSMLTHQKIPMDKHIAWFEAQSQDDTSVQLIFEANKEPVGVMSISKIDRESGICTWGFYLGKSDLPRGLGTQLGLSGIHYTFEVLGMRKLFAEVIAFNEASIRLHQKLGFIIEGRLVQHLRRDDAFLDIILYALFNE